MKREGWQGNLDLGKPRFPAKVPSQKSDFYNRRDSSETLISSRLGFPTDVICIEFNYKRCG